MRSEMGLLKMNKASAAKIKEAPATHPIDAPPKLTTYTPGFSQLSFPAASPFLRQFETSEGVADPN